MEEKRDILHTPEAPSVSLHDLEGRVPLWNDQSIIDLMKKNDLTRGQKWLTATILPIWVGIRAAAWQRVNLERNRLLSESYTEFFRDFEKDYNIGRAQVEGKMPFGEIDARSSRLYEAIDSLGGISKKEFEEWINESKVQANKLRTSLLSDRPILTAQEKKGLFKFWDQLVKSYLQNSEDLDPLRLLALQAKIRPEEAWVYLEEKLEGVRKKYGFIFGLGFSRRKIGSAIGVILDKSKKQDLPSITRAGILREWLNKETLYGEEGLGQYGKLLPEERQYTVRYGDYGEKEFPDDDFTAIDFNLSRFTAVFAIRFRRKALDNLENSFTDDQKMLLCAHLWAQGAKRDCFSLVPLADNVQVVELVGEVDLMPGKGFAQNREYAVKIDIPKEGVFYLRMPRKEIVLRSFVIVPTLHAEEEIRHIGFKELPLPEDSSELQKVETLVEELCSRFGPSGFFGQDNNWFYRPGSSTTQEILGQKLPWSFQVKGRIFHTIEDIGAQTGL